MRKSVFGFLTRFDTNWAVWPQKMARGSKFEVVGLCYLSSENKYIDQLRGYQAADLRLCFRLCKRQVFSDYLGLRYNHNQTSI